MPRSARAPSMIHPNMHRVLQIREILTEIMEFASLTPTSNWGSVDNRDTCDDKTMVSLARTCRTFVEPALDILWRDQWTIVNLLKCFPSDMWVVAQARDNRTLTIRRPPVAQDWQRVLYYAPRIKRLTNPLHEFCETTASLPLLVDPSFLQALSITLSTDVLLPRLRDIRWNCTVPRRHLWRYAHLFMSPSVDRFTMYGGFDGIQDDIATLLVALKSRSPLLLSLTSMSRHDHDYGDHVTAVHSDLVTSSNQLQTFTSYIPLTANASSHLAALPTLTSLGVHLNRGPWLTSLPIMSNLPFHFLTEINLGANDIEDVTNWIRAVSSSQITRMTLDLDSMPSSASIEEAFSVLTTRCPNLTWFCLDNHPPPEWQHGVYTYVATNVQILAGLRDLVVLRLSLSASYDLNDEALKAMSLAWPQLKILEIISRPPLFLQEPCRVTLAGLIPLAINCPKLDTLSITVDACTIPERGTLANYSNILVKEFTVGWSMIEDPFRVAEFIYGLFPEVYIIHWWLEEDVPEDRQSQLFASRWDDVNRRLANSLWRDGIWADGR